ncbi:unnamed protein product [Oikopleura dioica]|uniref:Peptidase M14 domain-containing protein n=1 Tax=Oikopleura dioica TaxID=34765 RepID=E4XEU8_OIKDI|nr:unnamed protein product [Oikopleura dioica]
MNRGLELFTHRSCLFLVKISKDFVKLHKTLLRQEPCMHGADEFQEKGITNGAAWYSTIGTLQDYEYIAQGVMAFTLELGCQKTTAMANLPWHGYMGIRGKVHDERGHVISNAEIFIEETYWNGTVALNPLSVLSDENGNFNKIFWSENATAKVSVHVTHDKFQEKTFTLREPILRELKDFRHCRQTNSFLENSCEYKLPRAIKIKLLKQRK